MERLMHGVQWVQAATASCNAHGMFCTSKNHIYDIQICDINTNNIVNFVLDMHSLGY